MSTAARFRAAVEAADMGAVRELLAPDIVFHSPVTFHPFIGRETVGALLQIVGDTSRGCTTPTSSSPTGRTRWSSAQRSTAARSRGSTCCDWTSGA